MNRLIISLSVVFVTCSASKAASEHPTLDLSKVTAVNISGDVSNVLLTTSADKPYTASLATLHKGWSSDWASSWFYNDCVASSDISLDGTTLLVNLVSSSWYSISDCVVETKINIPPDARVNIDLSASMLALIGSFSRVDIDGSALDFSLDGHVKTADLSGNAMRVRMNFSHLDNDETISISSKAMLADLDFGENAEVDYTVLGTSNFIDSRLTNNPEAGTKLKLDGNFVMATIR